MSNPISDHVLHPQNPALVKETNIPKENGQTRVLPDGCILYRNPLTNTEVPAVRLNDIRPRLVQEASTKISYRFPKKRGYEDTNVTAFVKKDYNFGPSREHRPDRLFQIQSNGAKGVKPNGYVMYEGRIVLDAFDHGLRNFGSQLPMYVSSELEGHDIEDYLRRNWEISMYDLVARAPNGYWTGNPDSESKKNVKQGKANKWHDGPPRVGTFSMRATRFRMYTGLLSWDPKDGTASKNQRILEIIPAQYKDPAVNSTKGWRDLNPAEIKMIKDGAMKKPQRARKKHRAAKAEKERQDKESTIVECCVEGEVYHKDGGKVSYVDKDAWFGAPSDEDSDELPEYDSEGLKGPMPAPQVHRMSTQINEVWRSPRKPVDIENEPSQLASVRPRKRSGVFFIADLEGGSNFRTQDRARFTAATEGLDNKGCVSRIPRSRVPRQQLDDNWQRGPHDSVPHIEFAQIDDIKSMNQRYNISPFDVKQEKPRESKTIEKRKRTSSSTTEHLEGQRLTKRTEEHKAKQSMAPKSATTTEAALREDKTIPTTELEIPTQDGQMDPQNTASPHTTKNMPDSFFQDLLWYADEANSHEEDIPVEQQEHTPSSDTQRGEPERQAPPMYWP